MRQETIEVHDSFLEEMVSAPRSIAWWGSPTRKRILQILTPTTAE